MLDTFNDTADKDQEIAALKEALKEKSEENKRLRATNLFVEIEQWSNVYDFSFQFWGPDQNNVFISKDGIDLTSFGGERTIQDILTRALEWANNQNPKGYTPPEPTIYRCQGCGARIAPGNDFCGECLCEDDGDFY